MEFSVSYFVAIFVAINLNKDFSLCLTCRHGHHHTEWLVIVTGNGNIVNGLNKESLIFVDTFRNYDGHFVTFSYEVARLFETHDSVTLLARLS